MKKLVLLALLPLLGGCPPEGKTTADTACATIKELLYPNCKFSLSPVERAALTPEHKQQLNSVKIFFRSCPQYKECGGK